MSFELQPASTPNDKHFEDLTVPELEILLDKIDGDQARATTGVGVEYAAREWLATAARIKELESKEGII